MRPQLPAPIGKTADARALVVARKPGWPNATRQLRAKDVVGYATANNAPGETSKCVARSLTHPPILAASQPPSYRGSPAQNGGAILCGQAEPGISRFSGAQLRT
ncbi:hypothetical protein BRAS3843_2660007 [Bradyrhizobium sp. STM 3843]|nr:hypothetical protein BRAS3843_2660007 [Bradyrhizobium sp. STM 3843]